MAAGLARDLLLTPPQLTWFWLTPKPKKLRPASAMITAAGERAACTAKGDSVLGRIWRTMSL
jgi:hypothetical protein